VTPTVFFDFETAGLTEAHPNIQLAAVAVGPEWQELGTLECKIRFDPALADPEALHINSYDPALWGSFAVDPADVVGSFAGFLNDHRSVVMYSKRSGNPYGVARLAGYNIVGFDMPRLQALFKIHGAFLPAHPQALDVLQLALWHFHGSPDSPKNFKLTTLCERFRIPHAAHDALGDVRATIALAKALTQNPLVASPATNTKLDLERKSIQHE